MESAHKAPQIRTKQIALGFMKQTGATKKFYIFDPSFPARIVLLFQLELILDRGHP